MTAIAAIYTARKQLGLDEDTARDLYARVTGKRSLREMSAKQHGQVLEELRKAGFNPAKKGLSGPFAKKLQALWIAGWNLGVVDDRRDDALLAFVKRQTSIDHTRFLLDAEDAAKAIDALKAWMTREAGVDWSTGHHIPGWAKEPGAKIALAQWAILVAAGRAEAGFAAFKGFVEDHAIRPLGQMNAKDWQAVMNTLGARVRKAKG
jgi:hypothetical protein